MSYHWQIVICGYNDNNSIIDLPKYYDFKKFIVNELRVAFALALALVVATPTVISVT